MDVVNEKKYGFVRRQTGGRGVLHDKELTYSVIVSEDHEYAENSYRSVSCYFARFIRWF